MIGTFGEEFDAVIVIQVGVEEHIVKKPVRRLVQQDGSCSRSPMHPYVAFAATKNASKTPAASSGRSV